MPLSRVQISRDDLNRQATVKWSDCNHERPNLTDGNYNRKYDFVYDDGNPNIALQFLFRNSGDARDFESIILHLSFNPIFSWPTSSSFNHVYNIWDHEPNPKEYKGLILLSTRYEWKYSDLFYIYRDTDYLYDSAGPTVRFPQVIYTNYVSTHVDKLFPPAPERPPQFSHCEKRVGNVSVEFDDERSCMDFISSLTSGHELLFSRRARSITTKASRFGSSKSNKGPAEVQLWRKGNSIHLLSRWVATVEDKWISMVLRSGSLEHRRDDNRASFARQEYYRGRKIDMSNLVARDPLEKSEWRRDGPVSIAFETVRGELSSVPELR